VNLFNLPNERIQIIKFKIIKLYRNSNKKNTNGAKRMANTTYVT
jgi:hypothetical protein